MIFASSFEELQEMFQELNKESKLVGLKMNLSKTKICQIILFPHRRSLLANDELETVHSYNYLGQGTIMNGSIVKEIKNRIKLA